MKIIEDHELETTESPAFAATIEKFQAPQLASLDPEKPTVMRLHLRDIKRDRRLQKRYKGTNQTVVRNYAALMVDGEELDRPKVKFDGEHYWLTDGYHTYSAAFTAGIEELECDVTSGTFADAEWDACASNRRHGLQRTDDDIRVAVIAAIKLKPELSNRAIAKHLGCDHKTVGHWRDHLNESGEFPSKKRKPGCSPDGHTFEELVELYAQIGVFKLSGDPKLKYELERPTGSHFFHGLDEAFRNFPRLHAAYTPAANVTGNGENRAASAVTGSVPFSYTPDLNQEASQAISDGGMEDVGEDSTTDSGLTQAQRLLRREIPATHREAWEKLPIDELRRQLMEYQNCSYAGGLNDEDMEDLVEKIEAQWEHRGWKCRTHSRDVYESGVFMDLAFGDEVWCQIEPDIAPYEPDAYCIQLIDWVEWAIADVSGQMELPIEPSPLVLPATPIIQVPEHPAGVLASAKSHEHYSPEEIWRPGLECFDIKEYDLDPASYDGSPIPCKKIFTKREDGLKQEWVAQYLWSNFPYSDRDENDKIIPGVMNAWVTRLIDAYNDGSVENALTLTKGDCRTGWYHQLLEVCTAFCQIKGAVKHGRPKQEDGDEEEKKNNGSFFGSTVFLLGGEIDRFYYAYSPIGTVCQPLERGMFGE